MNNLNVYAFFDKISNTFLPQFFLIQNDNVAKRSFHAFVSSPQFPYKDIVQDLAIYHVASFDVQLGMTEIKKEFLIDCMSLINVDKEVK